MSRPREPWTAQLVFWGEEVMERSANVDLEVPIEQATPHRRAGEQRLEILTNSPLAKVLIWMVNTIFLPIVAWTMLTVLSELRTLNDAIAKNNTIVALYDLRLTTLEHVKTERDIVVKGLGDKSIEHEQRLTTLEQRVNNLEIRRSGQ
jgi:hypothetical protein